MSSKKGFLEERPGQNSAMRVMSVMALLAAIGFGVLILTSDDPTKLGV